MGARRYAWILPVAAALGVALIAERAHARAAAQSAALTDARVRNAALRRLMDENRRLEAAQLTDEERRELAAKRSEIESLRSRLSALQAKAAPKPGSDAEAPEFMARDWTYAGRATPRAAIESVLWAASRGDVDKLSGLLAFKPEVQAQVDALFAKLPEASRQEFGSAENVIATMLAGSFPKNASSMKILVEKQWGDDAAIAMSVEHSDGNSHANQFTLHNAPDGWQLLVPSSVIDGYERTLVGERQGEGADQP